MKGYKTILIFILSLILAIASVVTAFAENRAWYIRRNGNDAPTPPADIEVLRTYNAFYINENLKNGEKKLYLTFDAGYENGNIEKILDVLKEENIPAAFFVLDHLIIKNTDLVIRMAEEGHLVCNHTKNHKNLSEASKNEIINDLTSLEKIYYEYTGKKMDKFFRFPEGRYSENALKCISEMGYKTIFWSFAYEDWDNSKQPSEKYAINKILSNTHNGAVILLHPTSKTNAKIMPYLIKEWKSMGYNFGCLTDFE